MSQLNDSNVIKSILQTHCDEMIWYRVPRDAPGSVDLATYMFQQTRMYNSLDEKVCRKVAMKVMYHSRINLTKVVEHSNKKKYMAGFMLPFRKQKVFSFYKFTTN